MNWKISLLLLVLFFKNASAQNEQTKINLTGTWKVVKVISGDYHYPEIKQEDINRYLNKEAIITPNFIINNICSSPTDTCNSPRLKYKTRTAVKASGEDPKYLSWIGFTKDYMETISSNCNPPFVELVVLDNNMIIGDIDGFYVYMERINVLPKGGDTVRCIYGNKCGFSGYVIQGTRAKGHAIHVNPVNKNVPMEQIDKKDLKKEDTDK